jgi:hypothetical protein
LGERFEEESLHRQKMMRSLLLGASARVSAGNLGAMLIDWQTHARLTARLRKLHHRDYPGAFSIFEQVRAELAAPNIGLLKQSPLWHYGQHLQMDANLHAKLRATRLAYAGRLGAKAQQQLAQQRAMHDPYRAAQLIVDPTGAVRSVGPDGVDDQGANDDIRVSLLQANSPRQPPAQEDPASP